MEEACYGMRRATAFVDKPDHHALMYVRQGQLVKEECVEEAKRARIMPSEREVPVDDDCCRT